MANGDQLKALFRSYAEGDDRHFYSVAMQMAAHEAKQGHGKLAVELRDLLDTAKSRRNAGPAGAAGGRRAERPLHPRTRPRRGRGRRGVDTRPAGRGVGDPRGRERGGRLGGERRRGGERLELRLELMGR